MSRYRTKKTIATTACMALVIGGIAACSSDGAKEETIDQTSEAVIGHPGLVGQWDFSTGSGQVAVDSSGNGFNGQLGSTNAADASDPIWANVGAGAPAELPPSALTFSAAGDPDFVRIPNDPKLQNPRVSVETWMKSGTPPATNAYLVSKGAEGCSYASYALYANASTGLHFGFADTAGNWHDSPGKPIANVYDNNWHHVVGTYDGTSLKLYVDGSLVGTTAVTATIKYGLTDHNALFLGSYRPNVCPLGYTGTLDGVRVYNEALNASDVIERMGGEPTLVGDWRFDAGTGQSLVDSVNGLDGFRGQNATVETFDPAWVAVAAGADVPVGVPPYALSFAGAQYARIPNSERLERQRITAELWMKSSSTSSGNEYLLSKGAEGCSSASYAIYKNGNGLTFGIRDLAGNWHEPTPKPLAAVADDKWHHVVGTYDGAAVKLYVDGQFVSQKAIAANIKYDLTTSNFLAVGAYPNQACPLAYNGLVDEVRYYEGALSAAEVQARFVDSGPTPPPQQPNPVTLIAQYSFRTGAGQRAYDSSVNNLDGVLGGMLSTEFFDPSDPTWIDVPNAPLELQPNALRFNGGGASDYVRVPNSFKLERNRLSVELWMRTNNTPTENAYLVAKGANACESASYAMYIHPTAGLRFGARDMSGTWRDSPAKPLASVNDGAWHHVVGSYDGAALRLYFDGALVGATPMTGAIQYGLATHNDLLIGSYLGGTADCRLGYTGVLDEVRFWREALLPAQITLRMAGTELLDDDQDGAMNTIPDRCANTPSTSTNAPLDYIANARGCSVAQCCPASGPRGIVDNGCPKDDDAGSWRTHGAYVSCVSNTTNQLFNQGKLTKAEQRAINSAASQSDIGKD